MSVGIVDLLAKLLLLDWVVIELTILVCVDGLIEVTTIATLVVALTPLWFLLALLDEVIENLGERPTEVLAVNE